MPQKKQPQKKQKTEELEQDFSIKDFESIDREVVFQGFMTLERLQLKNRLFQGGWSEQSSRELRIRKDAVAVLLYDPKLDAVVMVEQFRVGAIHDSKTPWMLELVAGLIESGESPEEVAKRECVEEADCEILVLEPIFEFYLSPGACTEKLFLFAACVDASQLGGVHGLESEGEDIKVHVLPAELALDYLSCGRINNAIGLIALQWLQMNRPRLRKEIE